MVLKELIFRISRKKQLRIEAAFFKDILFHPAVSRRVPWQQSLQLRFVTQIHSSGSFQKPNKISVRIQLVFHRRLDQREHNGRTGGSFWRVCEHKVL